ncbi:MAG: preprotein translocase subunit SecG [Bacteroidetes bacterium]|nr:preprotein translocase subunit SecG [Bacteroidota bacterium]
MSTLISIALFIICILLSLIVLVQKGKGGGLSSSFASNNQLFGVKRTADGLEKLTWGFAIALFVLCLLSVPKKQASADAAAAGTESVTRKKAETMMPTASPATPQAPAAQPVQQQQPASNPAPQGK